MSKTKLQIIDETVEQYSDPKNRASYGHSCEYITSDGRMCAFGRCMIKPLPHGGTVHGIQLNYNNHIDSNPECGGEKVDHFDKLLKPEYHGHDVGFWRKLQELHDNKENFSQDGWSEIGLKEIERLKEVYAEN